MLLSAAPAVAQRGTGITLGEAGEAPAVDPRAEARRLFEEGVELASQESWQAAASRFEEALDLHRAPAIQYNLASAYFELGRLGEADDHVAAVLGDPETSEDLREHAMALDGQIQARAGTLRVDVAPAGNEGAVLRIDGHEVPADRVGRPRREAPGAHVVVLERPDGSTEEQRVEIETGEDASLSFGSPLVDDGEGGGGGDGGGDSLWTDWRLWAVVGGVVVFTIIMTALLVSGGEDEVGGDYQPPILRF